MSTLYRPVLIESAEQAEALPHGSILRTTFTINLDPTEFIEATAFKAGDVWWSDGKVIAASELIGWTALVPVPAEERTYERKRGCDPEPEVFTQWTTGLVRL